MFVRRMPDNAHCLSLLHPGMARNAHQDRVRAGLRGDEGVGAEILGGFDARFEAFGGEAHVLGTHAREGAAAVQGEQVHRRRADEARGERGRGPRVEVLGRADLLDAPVAQQHHAVGHRHRLGLVVGDVHHRDAEALLQRSDLAAHFAPQLRVEVRQRLVHEADGRLGDQGAAERHALLLAAGKLRGLAREERHEPEHLGHAFQFRVTPGHLAHPQAEDDVLGDREVREERIGLEHHRDSALGGRKVGDVAFSDADGPRGRRIEARDKPQGGRLAAARGTQQDLERARLGREGDPVQLARLSPVLRDLFETDG